MGAWQPMSALSSAAAWRAIKPSVANQANSKTTAAANSAGPLRVRCGGSAGAENTGGAGATRRWQLPPGESGFFFGSARN